MFARQSYKGMKKTHKLLGLLLLLFMIWMAVSGVVLNHRSLFSDKEISRAALPTDYLYENWNYGFFKGSAPLSGDSVLLYGNEGVWLSDAANTFIREFNAGIKEGADNRKAMRVVRTASGEVYCATLFALYRLESDKQSWSPVDIPAKLDRISDMEVMGDSVVVVTRSELLVNKGDGKFIRKELATTPDLDEKRSLFRLIWTLHSGELFGWIGKLIVDGMAIVLVFLSITGALIWLLPKVIRRRKKKTLSAKRSTHTLRFSGKWHNKVGYWLTIPLLIVVITGSFLRPPLLIAISRAKVTPPPLTTMRTANPWHDLLRALRYDTEHDDWLLYTSEGFFSLASLDAAPRRMPYQPPVSVMGLNAFHPLGDDYWITGSFNGLLLWNRTNGEIIDGFTGMPYRAAPGGMPFGNQKVSGFAADFTGKVFIFLYDTGAFAFEADKGFIAMPEEHARRPMSWWNLALEMHTGRLFTFLGLASLLYPFLLGVLSFIMIYSGWKVYRRKRHPAIQKNKSMSS
nr:PepSY-associated TM helix domain-containing protein [Parabacteroides sp. PF5-6]